MQSCTWRVLIVLLITRALIGAIVVLFTVILSFAGAYGLPVFIWETLLHTQLHWLTLPIAFIVLVAVGCDYNLLLLSRYRDEIGAGIQTGLIRTMGSSGGVAITAGFVFAIMMLALLSSDVITIGQAGFDHMYRIDVRHADRSAVLGDAARPGAWSLVLVAPTDSQPPPV